MTSATDMMTLADAVQIVRQIAVALEVPERGHMHQGNWIISDVLVRVRVHDYALQRDVIRDVRCTAYVPSHWPQQGYGSVRLVAPSGDTVALMEGS